MAIKTRPREGLPEKMQVPGSGSGPWPARGMQRMVTLVASLIFASVSAVPSQ